MRLSIVIPCYNEAKTIRQIVERVRAAATSGVDKEIIVAGDGSASVPRETPPLIRQLLVEPEGRGRHLSKHATHAF